MVFQSEADFPHSITLTTEFVLSLKKRSLIYVYDGCVTMHILVLKMCETF